MNTGLKKKLYTGIGVVAGVTLLTVGTKFGLISPTVEDNVQNGAVTYDITDAPTAQYRFRNERLMKEHYEKHGKEMGFDNASDYQEAASAVICNLSSLHKTEAEDEDDVYYLERTNEFVIVSKDGYIRTYFCPEDGIDYFNRQ